MLPIAAIVCSLPHRAHRFAAAFRRSSHSPSLSICGKVPVQWDISASPARDGLPRLLMICPKTSGCATRPALSPVGTANALRPTRKRVPFGRHSYRRAGAEPLDRVSSELLKGGSSRPKMLRSWRSHEATWLQLGASPCSMLAWFVSIFTNA
jgi:hypothetical protein